LIANRSPLARQLTGAIILVTLVVGGLSGLMLTEVHRGQLEAQMRQQLLSEGHQIQELYLAIVEEQREPVRFSELVAAIVRHQPMIEAVTLNVGGTVLRWPGRNDSEESESLSHLLFTRPEPLRVNIEQNQDRSNNRQWVRVPLNTDEGTVGTIEVTADARQMRAELRRGFQRILLIILFVSMLSGFAVNAFLQMAVTRPLRDLAEMAGRVASGDPAPRTILPWNNEIGMAARAVGAMADTLLAQAQSLRASEARHRVVFQSASDACLGIDFKSGQIMAANDAAAALTRRPVEDLIGKRFGDFVSGEQRDTLRRLVQSVVRHGEVLGIEELRVLRSDGSDVPVRLNARRVSLGSDSLVFATLHDISLTLEWEQQLQRQLQRVTALNATSLACSASLRTAEIHRAISVQVRAAMPCDLFRIEMWNSRSGRLTTEYQADFVKSEPREIAVSDRTWRELHGPVLDVVTQRRPLRQTLTPEEAVKVRAVSGQSPMRSVMTVPMVTGERVAGVISVMSSESNAYSDHDLDLLAAMGSQVAMALNNAQLHQATQRSLVARDSINHIAEGMASTLNLRRIAEIVFEELSRLLPVDAFFLTEINPESTHDTPLLMLDTINGERVDVTEHEVRTCIPLEAKHTGHIVRTRKSELVLRRPKEIPEQVHLTFGDQKRRSASLMFVPLIARGSVVGVLSVQSYMHYAYGKADLALLEEIGDLTALALQNARLYQEMATSEARHRAIVESANVSIVLTNAQGHIAMWNPGAERVFGRPAREMIGKSLGTVFQGMSGSMERLQDALSGGRSWSGECSAKSPDGLQKDLILSIAPVADSQGQAAGHVVIASDMTEKKSLEQALLQAQKMDSIGTLAGGIAHDFNNLLTAIMGYSSHLQTLAEPGTRLSRDLEQIERASQRAAELTGQLLAFSRKQIIRHQSLSLNDVVEESVRLWERTLGKHIAIEVSPSPNLHLVEADPTQMQQVLMNLAINARDAMPEGGSLRVKTQNVELDEQYCKRHAELTPGPHVVLTVEDTGLGMDEGTMARIFDPFYSTKAVGEGTGLGLAMVYGIVHSHGGVIEVQSQLEKGSKFTIHLPASPMTGQQSDLEGESGSVRGGSETILIVDDEAMILRLAASILERYGYTVLTAPSGRFALDLFRRMHDRIDLLVVDMLMPEMNGVELAEGLRSIDPNCRILLSSGYTLDQDVEELMERGAFNGFLPKPYRMNQLARQIRGGLDVRVRTVA
jgi:PAS domain S-box-containing protein